MKAFALHIPKTGGRTLERHLRDWYGEALYLVETNEEVVVQGLDAWLDKQVVSGHQFFPFADALNGPEFILTILREPVDRVISAYRYIQRKSDHVLRHEFTQRIRSIQDFVTDDIFSFHSADMQTRMLGCDADLAGILGKYRKGEIGISVARASYKEALNDLPGADTLERAKGRLLRADVSFGLAEDMSSSISHIARRLGMPVPTHVHRENAAPQVVAPRELFSPEELIIVRARNSLDEELYQFAVAHFEPALPGGRNSRSGDDRENGDTPT
jgi:hypothetical protein